jgi:hypothetical protein
MDPKILARSFVLFDLTDSGKLVKFKTRRLQIYRAWNLLKDNAVWVIRLLSVSSLPAGMVMQ